MALESWQAYRLPVPVLAGKERLLSKSTNTGESNRLTWFLTRHWITSFLLLQKCTGRKYRPVLVIKARLVPNKR